MIKVTLDKANPQLAREWHPTKNGSLKPSDVTYGSHTLVWWLCPKNTDHEWDATIKSRSAGNSCPFCSGHRVCNSNCLATLNPELAREWHPTKNGDLTPYKVTAYSSRKVWWQCRKIKKHEWNASISNRNQGSGCPKCPKKPTRDNSLATLRPDLAKEWHPTINEGLTPEDVKQYSDWKVWWLCSKNNKHEWEATIRSRSYSGRGCRYCARNAVSDETCLATLNPELAKEWHPTKNGELTPDRVALRSNKKVWWLCRKNKEHEWQATVINRSYGSGCPKCYSKISQLELRIYSELKYLFPSAEARYKIVGKECDVWIPEINAGVEVDGAYWHLNKYLKEKKKADVIRSQGITLINVRETGLQRISDTDIFHTSKDSDLTVVKKIVKSLNDLCNLNQSQSKSIEGYLQRQDFINNSEYQQLLDTLPSPLPGLSLSELNPELVKEWHPTKNGSLTPDKVSLFSEKKVWWLCSKNNKHEWEATVNNRSRGSGCRFCIGHDVCNDNCLAILNPELAKEWHPTKNGELTPYQVRAHAHKKVWWLCSRNKKHEWQAKVLNRSYGEGCPFCSGKKVCVDNCLATLNPQLAKEWHPTKNGNLTPYKVTLHAKWKVWWQCSKNQDHEWAATINNRSNGSGCPFCRRINQRLRK